MSIKIYRYEVNCPKENKPFGAYTATDVFTGEIADKYMVIRAAMCRKHINETHPSIRLDLEDFTYDKHYCACATIESLKQWFKGFNTPLKRLGFNLVELEVSTIYETKSNKQVAYTLEDIISKRIIK